ncbi:sugar O-acetyltransferase [Weissella paramesenteroides]|uniref:sugar O-acetyltransferase n=1 Tax=Weissella paramesenteroides TaxID=1249 RepID=UPI0020730DE0|nr:sugar O-acetyltransferase [Weissella paramesenteroides]MCM6764697.1 sugar O-acetyltransferase [Weissella paramesenteroides]MCM6768193.1 sugar O-acetyltransferase [Weissella paramesenteroides]MCM6768557.1 sugar O-acetyltransferase [Weissella paramesenteroides]MCM6770634.1 sugar O-acetyltransferase [Weissella paramesenteroides]MCM6780557.1 sugar O-acetyltransferase [Weissella paramesenteroides]
MNLDEKFAYMATGQTYNDLDPILVSARKQSTKLTTAINDEQDMAKKETLIRNLFGSAGIAPDLNPNFRCEFGRNIHVGDYFYANYDTVILDGAKVTIGDRVLFGPKVGLYTSNHSFDARERELGGCIAKPITIGNRCWLAANVTVLPGVTIGDDVIIGAGSVVTHDIPSNVIAVGNPCHVLREITAADKTDFNGQDFI